MLAVRYVRGPYPEPRGGWRVKLEDTEGKRSSRVYRKREAAEEFAAQQRVAAESVGDPVAEAARAVPVPTRPTWVYLLEDRKGSVVYVGITGSVNRRLREHRSTAHARVKLLPRIYDRESALKVEAELIRHFQPRFNKAHKVKR